MAIADDLRKTFTDPTPLYFAAGTADLAVQQAKKVPALIEQLRAEAPARLEKVRETDPKAVQAKVTEQAKEAQATVQAKVTEVLGNLDTDLKKLGESAQDLALRGVGVAAEYAVRARETYEKVAEHGEQTVKTWRGEAAEEITEIAIAVEPDADEPKKDQGKANGTAVKAEAKAPQAKAAPAGQAKAATPAPRKAPVRKPAAKKSSPSAGK
ncbi:MULTISPECIES: hypothetical protein [unclassified Streptomyces]|uniref:hypothetical protein n=1 Tax=unclassified Streptomyces TaxID=2593676 RepID=UPI0021C92510|nr:hypothetical protein [Streptomyces sp. FIT100]UUN27704.1 hypothetical protein KK483_15795 [Streptomyces sp. FIT100]